MISGLKHYFFISCLDCLNHQYKWMADGFHPCKQVTQVNHRAASQLQQRMPRLLLGRLKEIHWLHKQTDKTVFKSLNMTVMKQQCESCRSKASWRGSGGACVWTATWDEIAAQTTLSPPGTARSTRCSLTATPVPSPSYSQRPRCCEGGAWNSPDIETRSEVSVAACAAADKEPGHQEECVVSIVRSSRCAVHAPNFCAMMCRWNVTMQVLRRLIKGRVHQKNNNNMFCPLSEMKMSAVEVCVFFSVWWNQVELCLWSSKRLKETFERLNSNVCFQKPCLNCLNIIHTPREQPLHCRNCTRNSISFTREVPPGSIKS